MARTALSVTTINRTGATLSAAAVDGSNMNSFVNDGKTFLYVKNSSGGSLTVTIDTPGTVDGLAIGQLTMSVANGAEKLIGPFPTATYNQTDDTVYVDWSAHTSVTAVPLKLSL